MQNIRSLSLASIIATSLLLSSCGGGGGSSTGDTVPGAKPVDAPVTGPDIFLLFPNPQKQADGTLQTNTAAYQQAYYAAIDPNNERDTLTKWKAVNGFGSGTGEEITVVFGDKKDLGYGRRMNVRRNPNGTLAFFVENYLIQAGAGYQYTPANLDAAVIRDQRWMVGINAIEFSPGPNGGAAFPKWYNFVAGTQERAVLVDLDGRGGKAMPGPCISCHGGRGDALMPPDASGKQKFNLVQNGASQARGDVQGHLHPFEVDAFDFSTAPGFTREAQEAAIKKINSWILCTYPIASPSTFPEDACRRQATPSEWAGTAADQIKDAYGGNGLPNARFAETVPPSWVAAGQSTLYQKVVGPACRTCHIMRGTALQSDLDFTSYEKFLSYSDRIKTHMLDRGNMPLAKIVYDAFYGTTDRPESIATFLSSQGYSVRDSAGALLMPGRPIADPGPPRVVKQGATTLSGAGSLYATGYLWVLVSGPTNGATLTNATSQQATFTATLDGSYVVQLTVSAGNTLSAPVQTTIVVNNALSPAPAAIRFADIKAVLQSPTAGCANSGCHSSGGLISAPVFYTNYDRNGDGTIDATDEAWFYTEVRSRVNFTDIVASPILRKPSNNHHNGLLRPGFNTAAAPGQAERASYDLFLNWILNGAPQ